MKKLVRFIISIILCLYAGVVGSLFTGPSLYPWYASLHKPFFNPPSWVFAPVWTILYLLMGISLYLVWTHKIAWHIKKVAMIYFFVQLAFNVIWSLVFFGAQNVLAGLIAIIYLWILIFLTIVKFKKISKTASWLLYPYLVWVSYATALNLAIVLLNK